MIEQFLEFRCSQTALAHLEICQTADVGGVELAERRASASRKLREFAKLTRSGIIKPMFFSHLHEETKLLGCERNEASVLKIQRSANGSVVFRLSGRIEAGDLSELQRLFALETPDHHIVMNLKDVTLVDRDAVKFLGCCEADGIKLEYCPAYVREWVDKERAQALGQRIDQP